MKNPSRALRPMRLPCARCRKPMKVRILFPGCDLPLRGMWSRGAAISATRVLRQLAAQGAAFTLLAHQLHEMSGLVDEEEVAGVGKYSPSNSFVLNFSWILLSLSLRAFTTPL